jgi:hypothetical protein
MGGCFMKPVVIYWLYIILAGAPPRLDERRPLNGWCRELRCVAKILTVLSDHASGKSVIKRLEEKQQLQLGIEVN